MAVLDVTVICAYRYSHSDNGLWFCTLYFESLSYQQYMHALTHTWGPVCWRWSPADTSCSSLSALLTENSCTPNFTSYQYQDEQVLKKKKVHPSYRCYDRGTFKGHKQVIVEASDLEKLWNLCQFDYYLKNLCFMPSSISGFSFPGFILLLHPLMLVDEKSERLFLLLCISATLFVFIHSVFCSSGFYH